jgi:hypothetical protein
LGRGIQIADEQQQSLENFRVQQQSLCRVQSRNSETLYGFVEQGRIEFASGEANGHQS